MKASNLFDIDPTTSEAYKRGARIIEALESVGILDHSPAIFAIVENEREILIEQIIHLVARKEINIKFKPVTKKYSGANERKWGYNKAIDDVLVLLKEKI